MHTKQFYEAPEAELLFVKMERNFCESPLNTGRKTYGEEIDLDDETLYY